MPITGKPNLPTDTVLDVAIIGAGVSGIYTGWRLMSADPGSSPVLKSLLQKR